MGQPEVWPSCLPETGAGWEVEGTHMNCCACLSLALTQFTLAAPSRNLGLYPHAVLLSGVSLEGE